MTYGYTEDIVWRLILKDGNIVNEGESKLTTIPIDVIDWFELIKGKETIEKIDLRDKQSNLIFTRRRIFSESTCETIIIVGWIMDGIKNITWLYPDGTSETEEEWGTDVIHSKVNPIFVQ